MMHDVSHSQGGGDDPLAAISRRLDSLQTSLTSLAERIDRLAEGRQTLNVDHTLGALEARVANLDRERERQGERIEQLLQWNSTVPTLERNVETIMTDLNQLGQRRVGRLEGLVGTAKTIGTGAVALTVAGVAFVVYLLQFLEKHVQFKP